MIGGEWVREIVLPAPAAAPGEGDAWGFPVVFSRDGRVAATADQLSRVAGVGVMKTVRRNSTGSATGAVLVYRRAPDCPTWRARGIDGDRTNNDSFDAGAVYLY